MADTGGTGEFWLPPNFLIDDDITMTKEGFNKVGLNTASGDKFGFPTEFSFNFGSHNSSSAPSSPVESVVSSTETETDEEDLLAGLTRQLARSTVQEKPQKITLASPYPESQKQWMLPGSPKSTLSVLGSPNGPSLFPYPPPATPLRWRIDSWDNLYVAAGPVVQSKMNHEGILGPYGHLSPAHHYPLPPVKNSNGRFYANQILSHKLSHTDHVEKARQDQVWKQKCCSSICGRPTREGLFSEKNQFQLQQLVSRNGVGGGNGFESDSKYARPRGLPQIARPHLQVLHQNQPPQHSGSGVAVACHGTSGVNTKCAGTGVFLPRRYGNTIEPRNKPFGGQTALVPDRVDQALNNNLDYMSSQAQPSFSAALIPDYDALMVRRNYAVMAKQKQKQKQRLRGAGVLNHELCLPQEWMY